MSSVSPVSVAVSAMNADRHQQRGDQQQRNPRPLAVAPAMPLEESPETHAVSPPPAEPQTPPEGPFAASQLAERLRLLEVNLRAISAGRKPWAPPRSDLNLRDRTV